ncbi:MAG: RNA-binding domain-containing protein [Candidatus Woesearchaeota archaeon]
MKLPINIKQLLESDLIEKERLELKESFNPEKIMHTMCAFANDFNNWGGGYIIIGVKDDTKEVIGIKKKEIDFIMKKLLELSNKIYYSYFPIVEPVEYNGKSLIIIYCPGGPARPYKAPKNLTKNAEYKYYIRRNSSTVIAKQEDEKELIGMSNQIPFDDQISHSAQLQDIDDSLLKKYLDDMNLDFENLSKENICKSLNIIEGPKEYVKQKNIGILMFSNNPKKFIKTPWIETTIFFDEIGDKFEEKTFEGNIISQIQNSLDYIKTKVIAQRVQKIEGQAESLRYVNYPYQAIEEALVNAVYHKSYEIDAPIEIRVELDRIDIISYPGPLPPLNKDNINKNTVISKRYRNRRIGEFLKEYKLTEGKNTGFRKIRTALKRNGSPEPEFITDDERVQFVTRIFIHEDFKKDQATQQVSDQVGDQVSEGLNEGLNEGLKSLLEYYSINPGKKAIDAERDLKRPIKTIERQVKTLIDKGLLERKGSKKTGGYFAK